MTLRVPKLETFFIDGPAGRLEATLEVPDNDAPSAVGVVCHPHPLYEGTLRNKVVHTLARAFVEVGVPAVRFNFRGVGDSEGGYAEGHGETDDALAVLDWAADRWPGTELWLGGFSFGSWIAMRAAHRRPVTRLATVAPAVRLFDPELRAPACPWFIVQGDADELVDIDDVRRWVAASDADPELVVLPGAGHFFHGQMRELREAIVSRLPRG